jgi:hypothetical protein
MFIRVRMYVIRFPCWGFVTTSRVIGSHGQQIWTYTFPGRYSNPLPQSSSFQRQCGHWISLIRVHDYSQRICEIFIAHNFHQLINSLDILQSCFSFEGYIRVESNDMRILVRRVIKEGFGRRWSCIVWRYSPCIFIDRSRKIRNHVSLLVGFCDESNETMCYTTTGMFWWDCGELTEDDTQQQHFSHLAASMF